MADNYLEKKYEAYKNGRPVIRKVNPSLDTLLARISDTDAPKDDTYIIKQAQLDAVIRSARLLKLAEGCSFVADEASCSVRLASCPSELALGQIMLAMQLKAAELHLDIFFQELENKEVLAIFTYSKTTK